MTTRPDGLWGAWETPSSTPAGTRPATTLPCRGRDRHHGAELPPLRHLWLDQHMKHKLHISLQDRRIRERHLDASRPLARSVMPAALPCAPVRNLLPACCSNSRESGRQSSSGLGVFPSNSGEYKYVKHLLTCPSCSKTSASVVHSLFECYPGARQGVSSGLMADQAPSTLRAIGG
jgi:hypothetical protein